MRTRSKALWQYLSDSGVLDASDEVILRAKQEYRRMYKRQWKRNRRLPVKELRPSFTPKEYRTLCLIAHEAGCKNPTAFVKQMVIASLDAKPVIPNKEQLQKVLQLISMSAIALIRNAPPDCLKENIMEAEQLLLQYLHE